MNRTVTYVLNKLGYVSYLYLDDRLVLFPSTTIPVGHTLKPTFMMALWLTACGGFLNLKKSTWAPTTRLDFLGLLIDTMEQTVEVPDDKYAKCMELIDTFLHPEQRYDIKLLERIRGKLNSWLLVIPNLGE